MSSFQLYGAYLLSLLCVVSLILLVKPPQRARWARLVPVAAFTVLWTYVGFEWAIFSGQVHKTLVGWLSFTTLAPNAVSSKELQFSLALGLVALAAYAVVRALWVIGLRIAERRNGAFAEGNPPTVPSVSAIWAGTGLAIILLAVAPGLLLHPQTTKPIIDGLAPLAWSAALAAALEACLFLTRQPRRSTATIVTGEDVRACDNDSLRPLYSSYFHRHSDLLLYWPEEHVVERGERRQQPTRVEHFAQPLTERVRKRILPLLREDRIEDVLLSVRHYEQGGNLLFSESLSLIHFVLFAEIMQHHHDQGDVTLLICPKDAVDTVKKAFAAQADHHFVSITERWAVVGETPLSADSQVNFIICSEARLSDDILDRTDELGPLLRRIRLLICLDVQAIEGSLLRISLARLWLALAASEREGGSRVRLISQAAPYYKTEPLVRAVLGSNTEEERLNPHIGNTRFVLVWDETAANAKTLGEIYFREELADRDVVHPGVIDMALTLRIPAWEANRQVALLDREQVFDQDQEERIRALLPDFGYSAILNLAGKCQPYDFAVAVEDDGVTLVCDRSNLLFALRHSYTFSPLRRESLLHVVTRDYPLRRYHLSILFGAGKSHNVPAWLRPWAPHPIGGLSELAWSLYKALLHVGGGLTRQQIADHFFALTPPGLLDQLGVTANFIGLNELFARVISPSPELKKRRSEEDKQDYYMVEQSETPLPIQGFIPVVDEQGQSIEGAAMIAADHGLSFAVGISVLVARKNYRVVDVRADRHVKMQMVDSDDKFGGMEHRFVRRYHASFLGANSDLACEQKSRPFVEGEPENISGPNSELRVRHLHACFDRDSIASVAHQRGKPPFDAEGRALYVRRSLSVPIHAKRLFQNVCQITLRLRKTEVLAEAEGNSVATLCVLFSDILASLFPAHSHRIAVVSPQAETWDAEDPLAGYLAQAYPVLGQCDAATDGTIHLLILEDSDHDLGVVRALVRDMSLFLSIACEYLEWLNAPSDSEANPHDRYYRFGTNALPHGFDVGGALRILEALPLPRSTPLPLAERYDFVPDLMFEHEQPGHCSFCGLDVGARSTLSDGRIRCGSCSSKAVDSLDEFKLILAWTIRHMEEAFNIQIPGGIDIRFASAEEIWKAKTPVGPYNLENRSVGLAIRTAEGEFEIMIENGAPRPSTIATIAHELTHIWQFAQGLNLPLEEMEGHAVAVEIHVIRTFGGHRDFAAWLEDHYKRRTDIYGTGYREVQRALGSRPGSQLFQLFAQN